MQRQVFIALTLVLVFASSSAWAHGEGFLQFLIIPVAVLGIVGGIATALLRYKLLVGLAASLGLLLIAGLAFTIPELGKSTDQIGEIGTMALWLTVYSGLPLALAFFIAFSATSSILRERAAERSKGEPAP
jgi:hypothetical protein